MIVYELSAPSTSMSDVQLVYPHEDGSLTLSFSYKKDGIPHPASLRFDRVRALRHRTETLCTAEHITSCYDKLIEVEDSQWIAELKGDAASGWADHWAMHHFMIYFDGSGCFEIASEAWSLVV